MRYHRPLLLSYRFTRPGSTYAWSQHPAFPKPFLRPKPRPPPKQPSTAYLANDLLVDLDAENCPAVRPFSRSSDDVIMTRAWARHGPRRARWGHLMRDSAVLAGKAAARMRTVSGMGAKGEEEQMWGRKMAHWRISEADVMVAAMMGGRKVSKTNGAQQWLSKVLFVNGVPGIISASEDATLVRFLARLCQNTSLVEPDFWSETTWPTTSDFDGIHEFRRLVSLLARLHTTGSLPDTTVTSTLPNLVSCVAQQVSSSDDPAVLAAALHVICSVQARWGPIAQVTEQCELAVVGAEAASGILDIDAMAYQFELALVTTDSEASKVTRRVVRRIERTAQSGRGVYGDPRRRLLGLLVSQTSGYASIRSYLRDKEDVATYIRVIVRLSAFRVVVHEWLACRASRDEMRAQAIIDVVDSMGDLSAVAVEYIDFGESMEMAVELDLAQPLKRGGGAFLLMLRRWQAITDWQIVQSDESNRDD